MATGEKLSMPAKQCASCNRSFHTEQDFMSQTSRWRICDLGNLWFNCSCGSTLVILKGKFPWFSPDKVMKPQTASVFNRLAGKINIPVLPNAVMRLQEIVASPEIDFELFAKISKLIPTIAGEILAIANSMKMSSNEEIKSIKHAAVFVGRQSLSDIVLLASVKSFAFQTKIFTQEKFWFDAFMCGAIAERLAKDFAPNLVRDEVYIAACMANIGKALGAIINPGDTDKIFDLSRRMENRMNWRRVETKLAATNHTIMGEIAAVLWGLPDYVRDAIGQHHDYNQVLLKGEESLTIVDVVAAAVQIGHWVNNELHQVDETMIIRWRERAGLNKEDAGNYALAFLPMRLSVKKIMSAA